MGGVFPVLYGNGLLIAQTPNEVVISYEMVHDTRVIPLDGRSRLGPAIKHYMGDSRGRFEGDTLVVETHNFNDKPGFAGVPYSDGLKLTEWFTRIDPQMIDYRIRVEDPATLEAPFTVRFTITQQPGYQLYEYLVPRREFGRGQRTQWRARVRAGRRRCQGAGQADSAAYRRHGGLLRRQRRGAPAGPRDRVRTLTPRTSARAGMPAWCGRHGRPIVRVCGGC